MNPTPEKSEYRHRNGAPGWLATLARWQPRRIEAESNRAPMDPGTEPAHAAANGQLPQWNHS